MHHVRANFTYTLDYDPIDFGDVGPEQVTLFETPSKIGGYVRVSVKKLRVDPKIAQSLEPRKFMNLPKSRADDEDGLDFSPAICRHRILEETMRLGRTNAARSAHYRGRTGHALQHFDDKVADAKASHRKRRAIDAK
jgi:hypothetical protein